MHVVVLGDVGCSGGVCCKMGSTRCARLKSERRGLLVFSRLHLGSRPGARPASPLVKVLCGLVQANVG
jgi:hypothetical protein